MKMTVFQQVKLSSCLHQQNLIHKNHPKNRHPLRIPSVSVLSFELTEYLETTSLENPISDLG